MRAPELRGLALVAALVAAIAIPWVDLPLARSIHGSALEDHPILQGGTLLLDWITLKEVSRHLLAALLLAPGLVLMAIPSRRELGAQLVFVGLTLGLANLAIEIGKPLFGRVRPDELLVGGAQRQWFVGGSSFPSGHTAFYFGLFLPLAWLYPRWRIAWLFVPVFIATARIDANLHYLADVCASIALASVITLACARLLRRWLPADDAPVSP